MRNIKLFLGAILIIILLAFNYINNQVDVEEKIIGTWFMIDPNNLDEEITLPTKWVFTSDKKCTWYESNTLMGEFDYRLTNYSCNNEYDSVYKYLKLKSSIDVSEVYCYAINGISIEEGKTYLSIEFNGNPKPMVFKKYTPFNPQEDPDLPEGLH